MRRQQPGPEKPAPAAATDPVPTGPAAITEPPEPDRLIIRFDDRRAALTPSGIRNFDAAVGAMRNGKKVQLAIEGCESGADFSNGSACARRLLSLKEMLAENGIRDVKHLLAEVH